MTSSPTLLIYLNSDVAMERPYRTTLPASVDTLAELCQFLTSRIPPLPGEDTVGRGYRFLYSVLGKPLWRVKECIDAGTIVLSVGPGFLARRPTAITENAFSNVAPEPAAAMTNAAAHAAPTATVATPTNPVDLTTPDRLAATSRGARSSTERDINMSSIQNVNDPQPDASPSASPPVKIPAEDRLYGATKTLPVFSDRTTPAYTHVNPNDAVTVNIAAADGYGRRRNSTNVVTSAADGGRESVDAAWPPAPSVRRSSQTDERDRLVSITLSTAARGASAPSGNMMTQSTPLTPEAATAERGGFNAPTPAVRLFTPPGLQTVSQPQQQPYQQAFPTTYPTSAAATAPPRPPPVTAAGEVPRGVVLIARETYALPPRPAFASAAAAVSAVLPHLQPLPRSSISSSLQCLLMRKWSAYQRLHSMAPADLIAGEAMSQQFNTISAACTSQSSTVLNSGVDRACRVLVSGPPRSGVSTTAAFLVRHLLRTLQFQPQHSLHNSLVLALDFHLLFGPQVSSGQGGLLQQHSRSQRHAPPRVLLDLASLYQLVVRTVMDAVVAQRPVLRETGPLLSQLWDLVIKPNVEPKVAPNFTTYTQAAALVGGDVLTRWTRLAEQAFPILQAACRTPEVPELRDAALDLIFYSIPAEVAASLNFSGLLYALDGAEALTLCYAQHVTRPAGDLGPLLQALSSDPRVHLVLSWPSTVSPRTLFVPSLTAHVSTVGLVTRGALSHMHFPQLIRSGRKEYPVEVFLGCPGYLRCLCAVVRPFRRSLTVPTTAYSSYYQQNYERSRPDEYAVRIDSNEVSQALDELLALVQTLPVV